MGTKWHCSFEISKSRWNLIYFASKRTAIYCKLVVRPISLISLLLKCLERTVDHHIRDVNLANMLLHVNQHAHHFKKSTVILV